MDKRLAQYQHFIDKQDIENAIKEINKLRRCYPLDFNILVPWFELALSLNDIKSILSTTNYLKKNKINKNGLFYINNIERRSYFQLREYDKAYKLLIDEIKIIEEDENLTEVKKNEITIDQRSALELTLNLLSEMAQINIPITMQGGTLLGIIRENNILKHDKDIDFCTDIRYMKIIDQYMKIKGFRFVNSMNNFNNFKSYYDFNTKITIDVMGLKSEGEYILGGYFECNGKKEWSRELLYPKHYLQKKIIYDKKIYMPSKPENILTAEYGDWEKENINWITFLDAPNLKQNTKLNVYYIMENLLKYTIKNDLSKIERIKRELKIRNLE